MTTIKLSRQTALAIYDDGSSTLIEDDGTGDFDLTSDETHALYEALHAALLARYSKLATEVEEKP